MILKEKLGERFGYFKNMGVNNVRELIQLLKKKEKLLKLIRSMIIPRKLKGFLISQKLPNRLK